MASSVQNRLKSRKLSRTRKTRLNELLNQLRREKDRRGSKPRCHWITHGPKEAVAARLTSLISPHGCVCATDKWTPQGFAQVDEAQLHKAKQLLPDDQCAELRRWWFAIYRGGFQKSPSLDIASTCTLTIGNENRRGLLLVEAKAHDNELLHEERGKPLEKSPSPGELKNHAHIGRALRGANPILEALTGLEWRLSHGTHYQMSNHFGWSARLIEMGYPVILVYLGFLNASEMADQGTPLKSHAGWEALVKSHGKAIAPEAAWNRIWNNHGSMLIPLIRSTEIPYDRPTEGFVAL
jgi:hypothetical protein